MQSVNRLFLSPNPASEKPRQKPKERREKAKGTRIQAEEESPVTYKSVKSQREIELKQLPEPAEL